MTTYVGVGAGASAVNASVSPALPAGLINTDLMILVASIRNSGVGTVDTPAGWFRITGSNNLAVFARFYSPGDAAPTVTFTGGVAGADTLAQIVAFRDAELTLGSIYATGQVNASAQDVAYPALNVTGPGQALLLVGWKQAAATGYGTPAGFTAAGIVSATTGDDASQVIRYQVQTTETDLTAGTLTATGGTAAISRAIVLAIRPRAVLTALEQNTWPPRVLLTLSPIAPADQVAIYRTVAGVDTLVRAGSGTATDTAWITVDAELPFGVPVSYRATINGVVGYSTSLNTYQLPGGKVALTDAITGLAAEVVIGRWPEKNYDRDSSVFPVGGRNVVVSGQVRQFTSDGIELYVETTSSRDQVMNLITNATEGVIQIRQPGGYDGVDSYVAVLGVIERRFSQDGSDQRRLIVLKVAETEAWPLILEAKTYTYADLEAAYAGLLYSNLEADYATYLALAQADL